MRVDKCSFASDSKIYGPHGWSPGSAICLSIDHHQHCTKSATRMQLAERRFAKATVEALASRQNGQKNGLHRSRWDEPQTHEQQPKKEPEKQAQQEEYQGEAGEGPRKNAHHQTSVRSHTLLIPAFTFARMLARPYGTGKRVNPCALLQCPRRPPSAMAL